MPRSHDRPLKKKKREKAYLVNRQKCVEDLIEAHLDRVIRAAGHGYVPAQELCSLNEKTYQYTTPEFCIGPPTMSATIKFIISRNSIMFIKPDILLSTRAWTEMSMRT